MHFLVLNDPDNVKANANDERMLKQCLEKNEDQKTFFQAQRNMVLNLEVW